MKRVLVTGASGFTGRYVVRLLLDRGYDVYSMGASGIDGERVVKASLEDKSSLSSVVRDVRPQGIVHLAALSFVGHGVAEDFYRVNTLGTLNLLEALDELDPKPSRIILASSANVYGTPAVERIDESLCPAPVNHYGTSKLSMEHLVSAQFGHLPVTITRPFNYTGPGQNERFLIPKIVSHFVRRESVIELGNLDVSRDFSDVRDVASYYVQLLEADKSVSPVNLCSGQAYSISQVLDMMAEIAGYRIEVRVNPLFVRANEIPFLVGDSRRLHGVIGNTPIVPMSQTLQDMYSEGEL
ncbi:GDP-mannose 4,6-dehydratase [Marinobacter sp. S6332]|uniref:GDP-mannose 4,6-dehydratase n=1 Tax=Marinobacter sp. S6332 TaxID=2926403 RepID=UPI001FF4F591|nr:GDP-mannose 4,6-dehydratase [Marinobacter sp. S6332]MCK0163737.1 GDP-mannose 4,6-dehydratase [Marinobacter sp. S6332]